MGDEKSRVQLRHKKKEGEVKKEAVNKSICQNIQSTDVPQMTKESFTQGV